MHEILDCLNYESFGVIFLLLLILYGIGHQLAMKSEPVCRWGLRIAATVTLVHFVLMSIDQPPTDAGSILAILFRALVTGAFGLTLSWIGLSMSVSLYSMFDELFFRRWRQHQDLRRQRREQERSALQEEIERKQRELKWKQEAPAREQARLAELARLEQARQDRKRKEDARWDCELLYGFHVTEISRRFSRDAFQDFLRRYMDDDLPPEQVEARAEELKEIIRRHVEKIEPPIVFQSLSDIAAWHERQQAQTETVANERLRRVLQAQLNQRYAELAMQFFNEAQS